MTVHCENAFYSNILFPKSKKDLQLGTLVHDFEQCPSIAQAHLSTLNLRHKANLLESILVWVSQTPDGRDQFVTWLDWASKTGLELLDVGRVAATQLLQNAMRRAVPRKQTVHDCTAKAHLLAWLGGRMERVIVAVKAVQEGRLRRSLVDVCGCWLLAGGWVVVYILWALGSAPAALADEEARGSDAGVGLTCFGIDEGGLGLNDGAGLSLVVNANNFVADFEFAAGRGDWERLQESNTALAIDDALRVELGNTGNWLGGGASVEVNYFLVGVLEWEKDRVCWEYGETWVKLLLNTISINKHFKQTALSLRRGSAAHQR
jgi:hypothetical protein